MVKQKFTFRRLGVFVVVLSLIISILPGSSLRAAPDSLPPLRQELWVPDGQVSAAILAGNTLYIGGRFTRLGQPTGGWVGLRADTGARRAELPRVAGSVAAILADGSGGWYLGGEFSAVGGSPRRNLAHIRADGTLDPTWVMDTNDRVTSLVLSGNFLYVGGEFSTLAGQSRSNLGAINLAAGALSSWAPAIWRSGSSSVYALEISGSTIYVGGYFDHAGGSARDNLAALDINSGNALSWDPAPNSSVLALALYGSKLYVGGNFTQIGGQSRNYLAAVDTTSGNATTWNPAPGGGGMFPSVSILKRAGDLLYIGGQFSQVGGFARNSLAALNLTDETITGWDPNITYTGGNPRVSALAFNGSIVYAGGSFTQAGGQVRNYLVAVNATSGAVTAWNPDVNGYVSALAAAGDTVYAGGGFTAMGGVARSNLAALDINTGEPTDWAPVVSGNNVKTMALSGSTLYIGGLFSEVGGQERNNVAAVDTTNGAVLSWNPDSNNWVEVLVTDGSVVYAGGSFGTIGGQDRFNLAALDPTSGAATAWVADTNGPSVYDLILVGNSLVVAGDFTTLSGQPRNNLGAVSIITGVASSWNPNVEHTTDSPSVRDILYHSGTLYLGGFFNQVGGVGRNNLAAVTPSGASVLPWNPDVGGYLGPYTDPMVMGLLADGNVIFAGGQFSQVGGQERYNLVALDADTAGVTDWDPGTLQPVNVLAGDGGTVYAGGSFLAAADQPQAYIAGIATVSVQTNPASNVSETSATLNGAVTAYADPATTLAFEWGTTPGGPYPNELVASPSPVGSTNLTLVSATLPTPALGVTYYYRLRALTSGGSLVYGAERSFNLNHDVYLPLIVH